MLAGCYFLHLYCDAKNPKHRFGEFPHEYTDELGSVCRKMARKDGWKINKDGTALCPKCSKRPRAGEAGEEERSSDEGFGACAERPNGG